MNALQWHDIREQTNAVKLLQGALRTGRIAHAYLFRGPAGVGRKTCASVFSASLMCQADYSLRPCGLCDECRAFWAGAHPDFFRIQPVDDKILIEQVRHLQQRVSLRAARGRHKVFVVEGIDKATQEAQNALLKVLEEPPGNAVFILIAHEEALPLPTIVSRCVSVRFRRLSRQGAAALLKERFQYGEAAELAAALGEGTVALAARLQPEQLLQRRETALQLLTDVLVLPLAEGARQTELLYKERDELLELLDMMQVWLRDVLLCQHVPQTADDPAYWLVNFDRYDELVRWAERLDSAGVVSALAAIFAFRRGLAGNVSLRAALPVLFLDLAKAAGAVAAS